MTRQTNPSGQLAAAVTKTASKQTYYTIRFFADPERRMDAYRAYAYFRWADDIIDSDAGSNADRTAFARRQKQLLESCYRGSALPDVCAEEWMLVDLVRHDREKNSGLQMYLRNMMDVMLFDAGRRGRTISQAELTEYSHKLAKAVTEAMYYFIGHDDASPDHEARYLAVTGAHITHMLRDAFEDGQSGYFNIPAEFLAQNGIGPEETTSLATRKWVRGQVELARRYFRAGRECTALVQNWRCRLAGYAYIARFEWLLETIARDDYRLRSDYPERKSLLTGMWMGWNTLASFLASLAGRPGVQRLARQPARMGKR